MRHEGDGPFGPGAYGPTDRFFSLQRYSDCPAPVPSPSSTLLCLRSQSKMELLATPHPNLVMARHQNPNKQKSSHKDLCGDRDLPFSETSSSKPAKKECCNLILHHTLADSDATLSNELSKGCPIQSSPRQLQEVGKNEIAACREQMTTHTQQGGGLEAGPPGEDPARFLQQKNGPASC